MIITTESKEYQKYLKKGSILKGMRSDKGAGVGLIACGIVFLATALFVIIFPVIAVILGVPGLLCLIAGIVMKKKRDSSYLSYYQQSTGFTEMELQQVERELTSTNVRIVACVPEGAVNQKRIACFITEHYFVMNGLFPYVRRLEDIIAAAYSDSQNIWFMLCLSKQDTKPAILGLQTASDKKAALCREIINEMQHRNPDIICGQEIVCEGKIYLLERDGTQILKLVEEGRELAPLR